jgi:hypothetical protein
LKGLFKWRERQGEKRFSDKAEKEKKSWQWQMMQKISRYYCRRMRMRTRRRKFGIPIVQDASVHICNTQMQGFHIRNSCPCFY